MSRNSRIMHGLTGRVSLVGQIVPLFELWRHRWRSRRQMLRLDERLLADIGLDRRALEEEARKPFWRG